MTIRTEIVEIAAAAYLKYKRGDSLTDTEVHCGAWVAIIMANYLDQFGPEFILAARELRRVGQELERADEARRTIRYGGIR